VGQSSLLTKLCKPPFVDPDPEISTFLGMPAKRAGVLAVGAALIGAIFVVPAVFMAASRDESVSAIGIWLGYAIWVVFLAETLVFIRLEKGWGTKWLCKHWLQVVVIFAASPLTAIVLKHAVMPMLTPLIGVQNLAAAPILAKIPNTLKTGKFLLKLVEVRKIVEKQAMQVQWLYRTTVGSLVLCGLGILGSAASGGAPTPLHGLELWWELTNQSIAVAPELFLVSLPIVGVIGGFALLQSRWNSRSSR